LRWSAHVHCAIWFRKAESRNETPIRNYDAGSAGVGDTGWRGIDAGIAECAATAECERYGSATAHADSSYVAPVGRTDAGARFSEAAVVMGQSARNVAVGDSWVLERNTADVNYSQAIRCDVEVDVSGDKIRRNLAVRELTGGFGSMAGDLLGVSSKGGAGGRTHA